MISLFFDKFLELTIVANAFKGIQVCVSYLIISAGIKMIKKLPKTPLNIILTSATAVCMITLSLLAVSFSSIFYIIIGGFVGLTVFLITSAVNKKKSIGGDK